MLLAASQIDPAHADALEPHAEVGERAVNAVVDVLGVGKAEDTGDIRRRQLVHDEQLDRQSVIRWERLQGFGQPRAILGLAERVNQRWLYFLRWKWPPQFRHQRSPAPAGDGAVGRSQLAEKGNERQPRGLPSREQLIGLDVRAPVREYTLEDSPLQQRQVGGDRAEPLAAIAMAKPVDGEIPNDGN